MITKYFLVFFILFIMISPTIVLSSEISSNNESDENYSSNNNILSSQLTKDSEGNSFGYIKNILDWFFKIRFKIGNIQYIGRYYNFQITEPTPVKSFPETVDLEYLNKTNIVIGGRDPRNPENWQTLLRLIGGYNWGWIFNSVSFRFELELPEDSPPGAWSYRFDPEIITISPNKKNLDWGGINEVLKTNLSVNIVPPYSSTYPTQDVVLKVKVIRREVSNPRNMRFAPAYVNIFNLPKNKKILDEDTKAAQGDESATSMWSNLYRLTWNAFVGFSFWLINKRANLPDVHEYVDSVVNILIRVKKDHLAELVPPAKPVEIHPNEVLSIPVKIKNLGSHIDTFNFRLNTDIKDLVVAQPSALTIEPGETKQAYVTVIAPPVLYSAGKTTALRLEAYSVEEPEKIFSNNIVLTIQGAHVSGMVIYYTALIGIALVILIILVYLVFKRLKNKICKKPDKPWNIPEEKEYLAQLKKKDEKQYYEVLKMMKEEYKSSLLWYKNYCKAELSIKKKFKINNLKSLLKEKLKLRKPISKKIGIKKSLHNLLKKEKKIKPLPTPKKQKSKPPITGKKDKILTKIRKEEEKQKKKFHVSS